MCVCGLSSSSTYMRWNSDHFLFVVSDCYGLVEIYQYVILVMMMTIVIWRPKEMNGRICVYLYIEKIRQVKPSIHPLILSLFLYTHVCSFWWFFLLKVYFTFSLAFLSNIALFFFIIFDYKSWLQLSVCFSVKKKFVDHQLLLLRHFFFILCFAYCCYCVCVWTSLKKNCFHHHHHPHHSYITILFIYM